MYVSIFFSISNQATNMSEMVKTHAMGKSMKRKEDPRFIQGRGRYIDDITLPGMLYMAILRSPYAHANITKIDTAPAMEVPGVKLVVTGADLEAMGLGWAPTFHMLDKQMVMALGKVMYQYQEVAAVVAETREAAVDGVNALLVEYEPLQVIVNPHESAKDEFLLRPDREEKTNHIFHWESGDKDKTDAMLKECDVVVKENIYFPRCHPAPLEPCGAIADYNTGTGRLTVYITSQAPHAHRTVYSMVTGIPESNIRVISPDIGGGFGNKVPIYPGYVVATVASIKLGVPVKWIETRTENITSTGFARDYHMVAEIGSTKDGKIKALKTSVVADHGAFDTCADPSKFPAGMFGIVTGSYDLQAAFAEVDAYFTNTAPGGVAYRCSFRVTEAAYLVERIVDVLGQKLQIDPAELRLKNFIQKEQFPYTSQTGFVYDSGDYAATFNKAMEMFDYKGMRKLQEEKRKEGKLFGIGISTFTEIVGAGPGHTFDIMGIKMFDSATIRIHPTGSAVVRAGTRHQGQGHETTWAQIVAEETGLEVADILVEEGDTDTAPYGLGTYGSRSTPTAGAALALAGRKIREKAKKIAANMLEAAESDIIWDEYKFSVKGAPAKAVTMKEIAFAAYTRSIPGLEPGLETEYYYDPPNLTFPNGAYLCALEIDKGTGEMQIHRFVAIDDCGNIINPMVVEGQIHGGLTEGYAIAFMQQIAFDEQGNNLAPNFIDYLVPTAHETPQWMTGHTITPSPHHPIGAKGVAESPNVGSPAAFVNAVVDALSIYGVRHVDMPLTRHKIWDIIHSNEKAW